MSTPTSDAQFPNETGENPRDPLGKFVKGNPGGPGPRYAQQMQRFRREFLTHIQQGERFKTICLRLIQYAMNGEEWAVKEILNRVMGRAPLTIDPVLAEDAEQLKNIRVVVIGADADADGESGNGSGRP